MAYCSSLLVSSNVGINPDPFIPTLEDTSREERYAKSNDETHQQDPFYQAHMSGDQDGPQDQSPVRISERIRDIVEEMRESNN